jgi:hypothetical protein
VGRDHSQHRLSTSLPEIFISEHQPEIFIGNCASKLDETTGEISDDATRNFIKQQLADFAKFVALSAKV